MAAFKEADILFSKMKTSPCKVAVVLPWQYTMLCCHGSVPCCVAMAVYHVVLPWQCTMLCCHGSVPCCVAMAVYHVAFILRQGIVIQKREMAPQLGDSQATTGETGDIIT